MPGPRPGGAGGGARLRSGGGFNPAMGAPSEHLDEAAMKAAMTQKQLTQQQSSTQAGSGKSGTNPLVSGAGQHKPTLPPGTEGGQQGQSSKGTFQPEQPREVGTLGDEFRRSLSDVKKGLASWFDLNAFLGINPGDTPEEKAKKRSLHRRYQKLTQEQQQVAQKKYREAMQKKKMEQEEEARKKQEEEQKNAQPIAMPSSTKKGPIGPASGQSKKQKAQTMLQQSRMGIGQSGKKH